MSILSEFGTKIGSIIKLEKSERVASDLPIIEKVNKLDSNGDFINGNFTSIGISDSSTQSSLILTDNSAYSVNSTSYTGINYSQRGKKIATFDSRTSGSTYMHIKTNMRTSVSDMFNFHVEGYAFSNQSLIDITFVGYTYNNYTFLINAGATSRSSVVGHTYLSSDGFVTLRLTVNSYYVTGRVSTLKVGNGGYYTSANITSIVFNTLSLI